MDVLIVISYFALVMFIALKGKQGKDATIDDYFLGSRNLKWYSMLQMTLNKVNQQYLPFRFLILGEIEIETISYILLSLLGTLD